MRSHGYCSLLVLLADTFFSFLERYPKLREDMERGKHPAATPRTASRSAAGRWSRRSKGGAGRVSKRSSASCAALDVTTEASCCSADAPAAEEASCSSAPGRAPARSRAEREVSFKLADADREPAEPEASEPAKV